jgi:hypothetical protein
MSRKVFPIRERCWNATGLVVTLSLSVQTANATLASMLVHAGTWACHGVQKYHDVSMSGRGVGFACCKAELFPPRHACSAPNPRPVSASASRTAPLGKETKDSSPQRACR